MSEDFRPHRVYYTSLFPRVGGKGWRAKDTLLGRCHECLQPARVLYTEHTEAVGVSQTRRICRQCREYEAAPPAPQRPAPRAPSQQDATGLDRQALWLYGPYRPQPAAVESTPVEGRLAGWTDTLDPEWQDRRRKDAFFSGLLGTDNR